MAKVLNLGLKDVPPDPQKRLYLTDAGEIGTLQRWCKVPILVSHCKSEAGPESQKSFEDVRRRQ
jgi:hypothetical protein